MAGGRNKRFEALGAVERAFRRQRRFRRVNVVMIRADVFGIARQHGFERPDDVERAFRRCAGCRPELPRMEIHQALGVERRGIEIVRILFDQRPHRVLVLNGERLQVGFRIVRIALAERRHVGALVVRCAIGKLQGALHRFIRRLLTIGIDVLIDVRSERQRDSPLRHRRRRIELGGSRERSDRLFVIERVDERQPLIEELLRVRARRLNRVMDAGESGIERDRTRSIVGGMIVLCLHSGRAERGTEEPHRNRHDERSRRCFSAPSCFCHSACTSFVIPAPPLAFFEATLRDSHFGARQPLGRDAQPAGQFERHRADRRAVGRQPEHVGDEKSARRFELHHRSAKHASEPAEHLIARLRHPFDCIRSEWSRRGDRTRRRPPPAQRGAIEERVDDDARHGADVDGDVDRRLGFCASRH